MAKDHTDFFVKFARKYVKNLDSSLAVEQNADKLRDRQQLQNPDEQQLTSEPPKTIEQLIHQRYESGVEYKQDDKITKYSTKYKIEQELEDWLKTIRITWAVCYDKPLTKCEITQIYKTFSSNDSKLCTNCTKDWMINVYIYNKSILTPSILVLWAYASDDQDASEEVKFMCNKYNATNPDELFNWKKTFAVKMMDFLTDEKYKGKKFNDLPEKPEDEKTIKYAVEIQDTISAKNYCIAFNCIDVDIAFDYWKLYGKQIGRAVAHHKK